jgi:hypothetical protein
MSIDIIVEETNPDIIATIDETQETIIINSPNIIDVNVTSGNSSSGGASWGTIAGSIASQTDLNTILLALDMFINNVDSTGLMAGGILDYGSDNTKFNLATGFGIIVDNYTDAENPVRTFVQWDAMPDITDTLIGSVDTTFVNIDSTGNVVLSTDPLTDIQRRNTIAIGWIDHTGAVAGVNQVFTEPFYNNAVQSQLNDFIENFGAWNILGNNYTALSGLTMQRTAGKTFDGNANYSVDKRDPHVVSTELESPVNFYYYYRKPSEPSGWFNDSPVTTVIDPNHWDDGSGTLQSVTAGKFTIQLISFYSPTLINDVQYGQKQYNTLDDAKIGLHDTVVINPFNSFDTFRAWLIIQQGCADLTNDTQVLFIPAGKLGIDDAGSGAIGGAGGEVNTVSNIGTSGYGLYKQKVGVDLQFKNIKAASSKISITEDLVNYLLNIDIGTLSNSDVGLSAVTNDAQLKRSANDFGNGISEKTTYSAADRILMEDSANSLNKKYVQLSNLRKLATPVVATPASPTAITSSSPTYKMFGLGGVLNITPLVTGNIRVVMNFFPYGIGVNGKNNFKLVYGTGTPPINGATAVGTQIGLVKSGGASSSVTATDAPIVWDMVVIGLSVGTNYWFDVQGAKYSTNTNVQMNSIEECLVEV